MTIGEITDKRVAPIERRDYEDWILQKHYAQRMPSISFAFGLYFGDDLKGVLTIGKPVSYTLCIGICGPENAEFVYELNRLATEDDLPDNSLSWFVGRVLRRLKTTDLIIVSYADSDMGHPGYIYQATNWIYTGKTKERTVKYAPKGQHPRHAKRYGDPQHLRRFRSSKHRYVYFTGKFRRSGKRLLEYEQKAYPKGRPDHYKFGETPKTKVLNKRTGEVFYE